MVIDADAHVHESEPFFFAHLDPGLQGRRPRIVTHENGMRYWTIEGRLVPRPEGRGPGAPVGFIPFPGRWGGADFDLSRPEERLKDMDAEGVDVQVIYPTTSLAFCFIEDAELAAGLCRAYNTSMAERIQPYRDRLKAVAVIPLQAPDAAVAELRRAKELGLVGAVIPGTVGERNLDDPAFFPVFQAADRLDLPLAVHAVTGAYETPGQERFSSYFYAHCIAMPVSVLIASLTLVGGGILERCPNLRVAFLEIGAGWTPYWTWWLHEHFEKGVYRERPLTVLGRQELPHMTRDPRETLQGGRVYYSCELEEAGIPYVAETMGENTLFFGTDYPHDDRTVGIIHEFRKRSDLSDALKQKILGENAARFYRLA